MRTLLLFIALSSASLFAQQSVPEVQKTMITKVTATWCPPCGGWGWDLFSDLVDDNSSSAVLIAGHYAGSDLQTTAGNEIADNFGVSGQPSFYLGNARQSATQGTSATARNTIKSEVDAALASSPVVNATVYATAFDGAANYSFETKVEFFQATSGEYSLAVYAVEDGVINRQTSRGNDAVHKRVMRGNIDGQTTFGEVFQTGAALPGDTYSSTFNFEFPGEWNTSNISLVSVLWLKNGDTYEFVNANQIVQEDWEFVSSTNNALSASDYRVTGFSESGILTTTLDFAAGAQNVQLSLIDESGRLLASRSLGDTPSGKTQVVWEDLNLQTGLVVVRLRTEDGERTVKVMVR